MKTFKLVVITSFTVIFLTALCLFIIGYFKPSPSGIQVNSVPVAEVYINGNSVGNTPYENSELSGTIDVRLIPTSGNNLTPYEAKIKLTPGVLTVVRRQFGNDEDTSAGDIVTFDKAEGEYTGLIIVASPENSEVYFDGVIRGFSPYKSESVTPGKHKVTVKAEGYTEKNLSVNLQNGYKLNLFVKLGKPIAEEVKPEETEAPSFDSYAEILDTPTGTLRVRTEPGTKGEEIAEVRPGEKYPIIEVDTVTGWYKIQYAEPKPGLPDGITGWISNQYSKKVEQ